jgi:hypothetical protein
LNLVRALYEALPSATKADPGVSIDRIYYAVCAGDFRTAEAIASENPNESIYFLGALVPRQIVALWLEMIQGNHPTMDQFRAAREELYRKVEANPTDAFLMTVLALTDAALGRKEESVREGQRAMEMRPISDDTFDGPVIAADVAIAYVWANQPDVAFEQLKILVRMPSYRLNYGDLKTNPSWDPLRKDPRFDGLLAEVAPRD